MTIGKGTTWGAAAPLPPSAPVVRDDARAAALVGAARRDGAPAPVLGLLGGDLARTCGATGDEARLRSGVAQTLPVDLGEVTVDGVVHHFVAHLVARRRFWRGRTLAVMNAQYIGAWDVAPRSHPNDGRLDVFDATLSLGDRLKARTRLPTGTHVPHPDIAQRRVTSLDVELGRGTRVWLDGRDIGLARALSVCVHPDAFSVVV